MLGYQEFDSNCVPLAESGRKEAEKTVVVEFLARHYGDEPVELNSFYLRDGAGTNYVLTASDRIEDYRGRCVEPVSEGISRPGMEITLNKGYGSHYYFYSRNIPGTAENLEFTQTHVRQVGDAIQPSHLLSCPSPPAPNSSQHQSLFQ